MNKIMIVLIATFAMFAVYCPSINATIVETETVTSWNKVVDLAGPGNLVKEYSFTDTTETRMIIQYLSVEGTDQFKVNIGNQTFLDTKKAGYKDTTNVVIIPAGKHKLEVTPGDPKDEWSITIQQKKVTTRLIDNNTGNKTKTKGKTQKKKTSGTIIKSFEAIMKRQTIKYTVQVKHRNLTWETINHNPYVGLAEGFKAEDFDVKSQIELANHEADWRRQVTEGLLSQIQIYIDSNGTKGFELVEMKPGDVLDWMYSGGGLYGSNLITLDVGKITMRVSQYCSYYENLPETRKTRSLEEGDNIQAIAFKFPYKGTMYVVLWFKGNLGGIDQCGNLAGMSYPIKTTK